MDLAWPVRDATEALRRQRFANRVSRQLADLRRSEAAWNIYLVEVEATADTGLDDTGYVHCELLRSINRRRLVNRIGAVDRTISANVHLVVRTLLDH